MAAILDVVKAALRRTSTALDDTEVIPLVAAAKADLYLRGLDIIDDSDPLTQAAIRLYVLYTIGGDEKLKGFYDRLAATMGGSKKYRGDDP